MGRLATWRREYQQLDEYNDEVISYWSFNGENWSHSVTVREFASEWGFAKHLCIWMRLKSGESREPSMLEKQNIIDGVEAKMEMRSPLIFEVFPAKQRIVDRYDVYHLWVVMKERMPFYVDIKPLHFVFNWKTATVGQKQIMYTSKIYYSNGLVKVYFLKARNGEMLRWYDKQNFKDQIIGENTTAIEFVTKEISEYTVLVCVPNRIGKLPFGLR